MPKYRVVSDPRPEAEYREPRGAGLRHNKARLVTAIEAGNLSAAVAKAADVLVGEHLGRRIVSVEEMHPGVAFSDEEITRALTRVVPFDDASDPLIDPGEFEDMTSPLVESNMFASIVKLVVHGLRESGLVPGLDISVLLTRPLVDPYAVIEIHDDARDVYLSRGTEVRRLTDDREATGWDGVLAVARELISFSNGLH
ncbi:hypothetical protein [Streptomyces brevispora]|uniref:hypothetical protein n=1 Tax=Streptomyces brevispora TaxID=887462 RepID=UPI0037F51005